MIFTTQVAINYGADKEHFDILDFTYDIDVAQAGLYNANSVPVAEVFTEQAPIYCKGKDVYVSIFADDPVPAALTSYNWQGHFNKRGVSSIR